MLVYQRVEGYKRPWTEGDSLNVKRPWNHLETSEEVDETHRSTSRFMAIIRWNIFANFFHHDNEKLMEKKTPLWYKKHI